MTRRLIAGEFRTGWPAVLACFAAAVLAWGFAAFGPAVYPAELQRQYGWSAALIASATTVAFIVGAGLAPWAGTGRYAAPKSRPQRGRVRLRDSNCKGK